MKHIVFMLLILSLGFEQVHAANTHYVNPSEVNTVRKVEIGEVIGLKHVKVDESNFIKTAVGGGIGYAIGSQIGKGSGNKIAKIAGTLLGASVAQGKTKATEITVRTERGRIISVIQRGTWRFQRNEAVKVMHGRQDRKNVVYIDTLY